MSRPKRSIALPITLYAPQGDILLLLAVHEEHGLNIGREIKVLRQGVAVGIGDVEAVDLVHAVLDHSPVLFHVPDHIVVIHIPHKCISMRHMLIPNF